MTQKGVIFDPYFGPPILSPCQVWSTRVRGFGHVPLKSGQKRGPKSDPFWVIFDPLSRAWDRSQGVKYDPFWGHFGPLFGTPFWGFPTPSRPGAEKGPKIGVPNMAQNDHFWALSGTPYFGPLFSFKWDSG